MNLAARGTDDGSTTIRNICQLLEPKPEIGGRRLARLPDGCCNPSAILPASKDNVRG
jgi:hypothetical protein